MENWSEKNEIFASFKKPSKPQKFNFLGFYGFSFVVQFNTNYISFHILIVISES